MHHENIAVKYSYILYEPTTEIARVASTFLLLWGSWWVVWYDREHRYTRREKAAWWFLGMVFVFVVILMSGYYLSLNMTVAVAWLRFLSLNIIDDVATKRNHFKIAMSAGFAALVLVIFVAAADNFRRIGTVEGRETSRKVSATPKPALLPRLLLPHPMLESLET
jgi:TRAP-type C4-dicarboxylate transport system permease large subunit